MDTVFAEDEIIMITRELSELASVINIEKKVLGLPKPVIAKTKRFGIVDLWKIHGMKRYANVYPRRI